MRSTRPSARCWSIAKSSAIFTGSLVVISVVAVESSSRFVRAAMKPSNVVGEDGTNGGLWCSPVAKTSRPTSSAFLAMATVALMRSCSVGVRPFVGSGVTSPTLKMPICMSAPCPGAGLERYLHAQTAAGTGSFPGAAPEVEADGRPGQRGDGQRDPQTGLGAEEDERHVRRVAVEHHEQHQQHDDHGRADGAGTEGTSLLLR